MNKDQDQEIEIDLREVGVKLISHIGVILLVTILSGGIAFGISKCILTPKYTSTTKLYILSKSESLTSLSLSDLQVGTQLTQDYMVLIQSRPVMEEVIDELKLDMEYDELVDIVTITNPSDTRILVISVEYPDAYMAKEIVDQIAEVSCNRLVDIMDMERPNIVEEGEVAKLPSSPHILRNTLVGSVLGMVLCMGVIVIGFLLDDTFKSADDVEKYLGIPTLGTIPITGKSETAQRKKNA